MGNLLSLGGTLAGMDVSGLRDAMIQKQFEDMQQQVQSMPPPASMPVPNKPNPLLLILSALAGSAGTALSKQNNFMPATIGSIQQRLEAPGQAEGMNREARSKFEADRQKIMLELRLKKLDFAMQRAKQDDNQEAQAAIREAQDQARNSLAEAKAGWDFEKAQMTAEMANERKRIPSINISLRDPNAPAGGAKGAGAPKYQPLTEGEQTINVKMASKVIPGKVETKNVKGGFLGLSTKQEKVMKPAEVVPNPDKDMALIDLYVNHLASKTPDAALAGRKLGAKVKAVLKPTDAMNMMQILVSLGLDKEDAIFVAKSSGFKMPEQEKPMPYTPSRKGGKKK